MKKAPGKKEVIAVEHSPAVLPVEERVRALVAELRKLGSEKRREEMAARYGIVTDDAFGASMGDMLKMAKRTGRDHALAAALWETGNYEARTLAALVDEPEKVTAAQMDLWCGDFDNWAICDTVCFQLFDRTAHAFAKVEKWARSKAEFVRRGAFALLASLALHDRKAGAAVFAPFLPVIETAASDDRNFVKKAVNWALRSIGERNAELHQAALATAGRLAASADRSAKWVGSDAVRQLNSAAVLKRLAKRSG